MTDPIVTELHGSVSDILPGLIRAEHYASLRCHEAASLELRALIDMILDCTHSPAPSTARKLHWD